MLEPEDRLPHAPSRELSYVSRIISHAKDSAVRRGADSPDWGDVWTAMARTPEMSSAFHARGIDASALSTEIKFIQIFAPDLSFTAANYTHNEIRTALAELKDDLFYIEQAQAEAREQVLRGSSDDTGAERSGLLHRIMSRGKGGPAIESLKEDVKTLGQTENNFDAAINLLRERVEARLRGTAPNASRDTHHTNELKHRLIDHCARQPLGIGLAAPEPQIAAVLKVVQGKMTDALKTMLVPSPLDLRESGPSALETLEDMKDGPPPAPADLFELIFKASDPLYEELMLRSGMRTKDADRPDLLGGTLPARPVQALLLGALKHAYDDNARELELRHITYQLLTDTAVQRHLVKLGVDNLAEFNDKVAEALDPPVEKKKDGTRTYVHPQLPHNIHLTIDMLAECWDDKGSKPELLLKVMDSHETIAQALANAGLTEEMRGKWSELAAIPEEEVPAKRFAREKKPVLTAEQFDEVVSEYCTDQTDLARKGKLDPMIGNTETVDKIVTTMIRRKGRNPLLTGEAGIGKTKVREGLALAIIAGQVPQELIGARVVTLELQKFLGDFSGIKALRDVFDYAAENNADKDKPKIILDFDQLPQLIEMGGASFIQPYLSKDAILLLATASDEQVNKQIDGKPAISALLKKIPMTEPGEAETVQIMRGIAAQYATHHGVSVSDELTSFVCEQAGRYIHHIGQPSKSIDLLDESLAQAKKENAATLERAHVHRVISSRTGIPLSYLSEDEGERYGTLEQRLNERIFDQADAVAQVVGPIVRAKAGFKDPITPIANFLFVGPTGVGKTELARGLAELLMGSSEFLVRFDMSEYMEKHNVSRLIGSPPGYVGNDEGGKLITEARRKPHAVFLYDESEKAHTDVFNVLLAPFSNGIATDGRGRKGNLRNIINIMTANIGASEVEHEAQRRNLDPLKNPDEWQTMANGIYTHALNGWLTPEFRNRLDAIIYFAPLKLPTMEKLVERQRGLTEAQLRTGHGLGLEMSPEFAKLVIKKGFDPQMGARPLQRAWRDIVETPMAHWLLSEGRKRPAQAQAIVMTPKEKGFGVSLAFKL